MSFQTKFERLTRAIDWSRKQLEYPRRKRIEHVKQFAGYHYADDGVSHTVPVNFEKLAVNIYVRALAARAPKVLISTKFPALKPTAKNLELAVNQIPEEIQLTRTLRQIICEALFSIGIAKVGLHTVGQLLGHDYGEPFVDCVTLDDYFVDMSAKNRNQIQFEGNDYWLTREEIEQSFGKGIYLDDGIDEESVINEHGEDRSESLSIDNNIESYKPRIHLRDVWVPSEGIVVPYLVRNKKRLKEIEWDGSRFGPYHIFSFDDVPGNLMPLPPASVWRDMHDLANALFRKLGEQADAQKTVQGFPGGDEEAVKDFKNASDGDGITWSGGDPKPLTAGGVDQKTLAFFLQCRDLFGYFAGNLDALGGLAPQAETLGQDRLLTESAGAQLRDMQSQTVDSIRDVFRSLTYYEWHDPAKVRILEKRIPGMSNLSIPVVWNQQSRVGDYDEYSLDIDVFSLMDDSPSLKLQRLGFIMERYILPLLPGIQAKGGSLNEQKILELVAKFADFDELKDIVEFASVDPQQQAQNQQMIPPPSNTTRTYERVSRPGATPRGKSDVLQRILLGDRPQQSETAVLG